MRVERRTNSIIFYRCLHCGLVGPAESQEEALKMFLRQCPYNKSNEAIGTLFDNVVPVHMCYPVLAVKDSTDGP